MDRAVRPHQGLTHSPAGSGTPAPGLLAIQWREGAVADKLQDLIDGWVDDIENGN